MPVEIRIAQGIQPPFNFPCPVLLLFLALLSKPMIAAQVQVPYPAGHGGNNRLCRFPSYFENLGTHWYRSWRCEAIVGEGGGPRSAQGVRDSQGAGIEDPRLDLMRQEPGIIEGRAVQVSKVPVSAATIRQGAFCCYGNVGGKEKGKGKARARAWGRVSMLETRQAGIEGGGWRNLPRFLNWKRRIHRVRIRNTVDDKGPPSEICRNGRIRKVFLTAGFDAWRIDVAKRRAKVQQ